MVKQISDYPIDKTDNIEYNSTSTSTHVMDLYRISNPIDIETMVVYVHGGSFINGTEENKNAIDCKDKFNAEGYNVISVRYTLQTQSSYDNALNTYMTTGDSSDILNWSVSAVVSAANDLIDAIDHIKQMGIKKINLIGYSAGAIMSLCCALGPDSITGLKTYDRSIVQSITSIAGSLTTQLGVPFFDGLDVDSPNLMIWHGSVDETLVVSGAQSIKNKYDELGISSKCILNILEGVGHDNIWTIRSSNLPNSSYDGLLPLGAASLFINNENQIPLVPICFPAGTPVTTDQGDIAIELLDIDNHTIRGNKIVAITQTKTLDKHIVSIQKDALGNNVPSAITSISNEHSVFYNGKMRKAKYLVDLCKNVKFIPYKGETLYNVLLDNHDIMMINNLICETLNPKNIMAKIINSDVSPSQKQAIYKQLSSNIKKDIQNQRDKQKMRKKMVYYV
tara:strand:+ start:7922 stop:9271 length:1350 start_codon:yes stop_codon:yes gene_type:complete